MKATPFLGMRALFRERSFPSRRVLVVNGNPDPRPERYSAALADAYAAGSQARGCLVRRLDVGDVQVTNDTVPGLATDGRTFPDQKVVHFLEPILWADRLCVIYPILLGAPPPRLQAVFEAFENDCASLKAKFPMVRFSQGKPARIVATATFPTFFYRLGGRMPQARRAQATTLAGIRVVNRTLIGSVDSISARDRFNWLTEMHRLGRNDRDAFSRLAFHAHELGS